MIVGEVRVSPAVVLAPMAGVTCHPFRLLAKEKGCGLVVSEMISARGLQQIGKRGRSLLYYTSAEKPIAFQLFGSEPDVIAEGARWLEDWGADIVDINLGCPTPKIVRNGDGGALMRAPSLCSTIFEAVVKAVDCPVTVKMRTGWDEHSINAPDIARRAEAAGVAAVAVHGRTVTQGYRGKADWVAIKQVKESVSIPVTGNGDLNTPSDAEAMLKFSGCDGVMIGRAALGNPWIFDQVRTWLEEKKLAPQPSAAEKMQVVLRHMTLLAGLKGEQVAVREMRRHSCWYIKNLSGAAEARRRLVHAVSAAEIEVILGELYGQNYDSD